MSATPNEPADEFDDLVLDDDFIAGGQKEASADERVARAKRIARGNARLRAAGEIADGSGKPGPRRRRAVPWIVIGATIAIVIVGIVLVVR